MTDGLSAFKLVKKADMPKRKVAEGKDKLNLQLKWEDPKVYGSQFCEALDEAKK